MGQRITIYSKPDCGGCVGAKNFMDEQGILFNEINIVGNQPALHHIKKKGFDNLPVIELGKEAFVGFNPDKILAMANQ